MKEASSHIALFPRGQPLTSHSAPSRSNQTILSETTSWELSLVKVSVQEPLRNQHVFAQQSQRSIEGLPTHGP